MFQKVWVSKLIDCRMINSVGSKVDSVFYPPEVDYMSTSNFWELGGKK